MMITTPILLTVASQCVRNMIQTAGIRRRAIHHRSDPNADPTMSNPLLLLASSPERDDCSASPADRLRTMNREDLLKVFVHSRAPTPSELREWFSSKSDGNGDGKSDSDEFCEWDGTLLDNNSALMTTVSFFMSNGLFGGIGLPWRLVGESSKRKGRWSGKAYAKPTSTTLPTATGSGINRFAVKDAKNQNQPSYFQRHTFDYEIVESKLLPGDLCLRHDYSRHQSLPTSLWSSMVDELRVVEAPPSGTKYGGETEDDLVLIGMGWMGWSGGPLNCSPFLLERHK